MRWILSAAVLLVLVAASLAKDESSNKMLLGGDDVDKKHAEMSESSTPEAPKDMKEVKKMVKNDKRELKQLQERARALKEQLKDSKQLSKNEKKELKREFRTAKNDLHTKKMELTNLKAEMKSLKGSKKHGGQSVIPVRSQPSGKKNGKSKNRDGGRRKKNKLELIGAEESKINNPEQFGLQSEPAEQQVQLSKKEQRKLMRKMSRKAGRKHKKGRKHGESTDLMEDKPSLRSNLIPSRPRGGRKHRGRKISCTTDSDCKNGAICFENRKGHKFCKGNGMDKTAGKKCHRSEQCARGLKCFVKTRKPSARQHRKPKGICADPATTDSNKGSFLPFLTSTSQN